MINALLVAKYSGVGKVVEESVVGEFSAVE